MVKVLGHWELGYHAPITEQFYWSLMLRDFGITDWNMVPRSGITCSERDVKLTEWQTYADFFAFHPGLKRVFIEPLGMHVHESTWLHQFTHPEDCVYVFGSAHYNPVIANRRQDFDPVVTIKTQQDAGVLWADQACALVLYDRQVKSWQ